MTQGVGSGGGALKEKVTHMINMNSKKKISYILLRVSIFTLYIFSCIFFLPFRDF